MSVRRIPTLERRATGLGQGDAIRSSLAGGDRVKPFGTIIGDVSRGLVEIANRIRS